MEERYGNIRAGAKGFVRYQDKSGTELDKETDHLFQRCGSSRDRQAFLDAARKADPKWEIGKPVPFGVLDGITRESVESTLANSGSGFVKKSIDVSI